jgi:hypothetical protein
MEEEGLSVLERQYTEFIEKRSAFNNSQNELTSKLSSAKQDLQLAQQRCSDIEVNPA